MTPLRTCILGLGGFAPQLGLRLLELNLPLEEIYDPDHDRALRYCLTLGCSAYTDPRELIGKSELVFSFLGPEPSLALGTGFVLCGEEPAEGEFAHYPVLGGECRLLEDAPPKWSELFSLLKG